MLGLYSDCPMAWLSTKACPDHEAAVSQVRDAVVRLLPGKDDHTGFCRALPLHRMFAHNKVFIVDTMTELADAIEQYPYGDRWRVESFARQAHDTMFMQKAAEEPQRLDWSRGFWNSNLSIAPCLYE
jgi:hypothetical protein